ncbi:MAG TPA: UvrD-helicase domain-containing protein [Elainellaceae cyanobacterium]
MQVLRLRPSLPSGQSSQPETPSCTYGGVMNSPLAWINPTLTPQQQDAAYANHSIAVTAGAGTGKTHMLAERYLHHLMSGYSPLEIVAVTFTEKAATEMRSRIRKTIQKGTQNPDWVAELEAAQISTFHALAARICREHPDAANVPPDFTVLDDLDGTLWKANTLVDALNQIPNTLYEHIPYSLMQTAIQAFLVDTLTAEQALQKGRNDWLPILQQARHDALANLLNDDRWLVAGDILHAHSAPADKLNAMRDAALESVAVLVGERATILEYGDDIAPVLNVLDKLKINCGQQKNWGGKDTLDAVKDAIKLVREIARDALKAGLVTLKPNEWDDQTEAILPVLREGFEVVRSHLHHAKQQQRVLDFNDLETHALKALEQLDVQHYYHQRWQVFLIDEFQDTNPIQGQLLERLTQGKLMTIIGDVKQSIYGFRRADVDVFKAWCTRLHPTPDRPVKELSLSFRTHHALVQRLNTLFEPILNHLHQPLDAYRQQEPPPSPHLQVFTVHVTDSAKPDIAQRRRVEANHLANWINNLLTSSAQVHDKSTGNLRSVTPGDIAILSRTWDPLEVYGEALEGLGIPILQAGGGNLLDTREVKDAWALLRFLADPRDDLALIAVLRSPFFAVSDRTLAQLAASLPEKMSWWKHLSSTDVTDLCHSHHVLQSLLNERRSEAPSRLLQLADRLTGYTAAIANLPNGRRREADWRGFLDFIKKREQSSFDGVSIVRYLRRLAAAEVMIPRPALEAGDAVSLMTIHASKGLEWPVVIVPDLSRKESTDSPAIRIDPQLGVALKLDDDDGSTQKSALYTFLNYQKHQADQDEAKRVLYVALTRARDRLILTAADEKGGGLDILQPGLDGMIDITSIEFDAECANPSEPCDPAPFPHPAHRLIQSSGAGLWELPVTAFTDYALCPKRFEFRHLQGHPGAYQGTELRNLGAEIGTLTHKALQHQVQEVETLAKFNPELPPEAIRDALNLAKMFHQSGVYAPYRNQPSIAEYPVTISVGTLSLNGTVDVLAPEFVLDFKTDQTINPHHHRLQLWAYATATERSTAHIAYLRHNVIHTFEEVDLGAIAQEAKAVAGGIGRGEFIPTSSEETCQICPYSLICDHSTISTSV